MSNEEQNQERTIGEEITWESIVGEIFRVQHFTPFAYIEGEKVVHPSRPLPYACLTIEDPKSSELLMMPVRHRIDFRNLWDIFNRNLLAGDCLYVSYYPLKAIYGSFIRNTTIRLFGNIMPQLALMEAPKGIEMVDPSGQLSQEWVQASTTIWSPQQHFESESTVLDNYRESKLFPISGSCTR